MKRIYLFLLLLLGSAYSFAQDFSNKGKDFWLGYGYHVRYVTTGFGGSANSQEMVLYFATENIPGRFTNIKIEIPSIGYVENISNLAPGTIATSNAIPKSGTQDARLTTEGLFNTGIHVTADRPVVAYAHIYNGSVSGATLLFPTNTLGKDYYSMNYNQVSNEASSNCFFYVVATDTGTTTVEITPSAATLTHVANTAFTVSLLQGEIYNVMGELNGGGGGGTFTGADLTGSRIRSISAGGVGCKKIAVFSGSGKIKLDCGGDGRGSADNLIAQAFPKSAWGKKFLTAPTRNMPFNPFRIGVSDPAAIVKINGVVQPGLINNFYYEVSATDQPLLIESDEPVMVSQYITTRGACGNNFLVDDGDPEMIYLSPIEQTIDEVILNSTPNAAINEHWINVIIKTVAVPSFNITGAAGLVSFSTHPQDPAYSYAQINVNAGAHILSADSGFNAIAYGYGLAETYGYNAGTNLKDLYNVISPLNPLNISGTNSACACTPFYYTITYPFQPLSLKWDFKGFQTNVVITNPVADSTYLINGKQVWLYKLPAPYSYCPAGNYPLSITAGTAGTDGCGNTQVKDDTLFVRNTPTPDFTWFNNGCVTDSVRFTDASFYDDGVFSYQWLWDFGDGNTSTEHNPAHLYAAPGDYTVKFSLVTNIGCISAVRKKQVVVTAIPIANFGYSNPLCLKRDVVFSDTSSVSAPGSISFWHWDFGDGSTNDATNNANQIHQYTTPGAKTATLQIETASGCKSIILDKTFTINQSPVPDFSMPAKVCLPYDLATFINASTIADGTENSFNFKWKFGEPTSGINDSAIIKNPSHLYNTAGPFNVTLTVTSGSGCVEDTTKIFSNIFAKATGGFTVNPENCFTAVTNFSSVSSGQGNTITNWYWNFGDATNGTGQPATHTYAVADTFSVKHWILTNKGCYSDTVTQNVIVHPLPSPNFNSGAAACEKNNITITDLSTPGAGNITRWTWNFGNGRPDSIINNALPFIYRYDTTGNYTVKLSLLTDKGCATPTPFSKTITVNPLPKPGFISPEVCLTDASAQFVDTSSISAPGTLTNWRWNFGDPGSGANNTFTGLNATHRYNAIGFYTATLIVTSNNGCIDSIAQAFTVNGDVPKANFIPQVLPNLCANDSVSIRDSSTVNFGNVTRVEIYWDVTRDRSVKDTDDLPALGKIYKHIYPDFQSPLTKNFIVRYKSYSGTSCVDSVTKIITVNASPKVQFNTVAPVCLDAATYQITEATETGGVPGSGVFTGPGTSSTGLFTPLVTGVGTFRILYTYTSAFGCVDTISNTIRILSPAKANFGFSKPGCEKNSITFTDSSSIPAASGTIANWNWNFGDGTAAVSNNTSAAVNHTFATAGSFTVTLTITTSNGCKVSIPKSVTVNPLPAPRFTFPTSACLPNASIAFTDASTITDGTENTFTYLWRFDDAGSGGANTSVSKNPTHIYTADAVYRVTLICTSGAGCKDSLTRQMDIIHPQPTADFTSDSLSICEKQRVKFSDNSTGADGTVNKWTWDFDNGSGSDIQFPASQTYNTAKVYSIKLAVENNFGCQGNKTKQFTVYANPVVSTDPERTLLEGGEITLNVNATGNGLQYLWEPAQFLNSSSIRTPLVKGIPADIIYTLKVTATGGCYDTVSVLVKLLKAPVIPNTFTPNGDGINDTWTIQYLESYPECRIRVFNRDGQAIYESLGYKIPGWDGKYNGKKLPFGTYYYVIEPGSGRKPMTGYVTLVY